MNAYLEELPPDTEGQETTPLSADKIMESINHSIPTTWKNKMIEQGFKYADSTIKKQLISFKLGLKTWSPRKKTKIRNPQRNGNEKTPTPVSSSKAIVFLWSKGQSRNSASYIENVVTLLKSAKIYMLWLTSINRRKKALQILRQKKTRSLIC